MRHEIIKRFKITSCLMNNQLYDKTKELILSVETLQGRRKLFTTKCWSRSSHTGSKWLTKLSRFDYIKSQVKSNAEKMNWLQVFLKNGYKCILHVFQIPNKYYFKTLHDRSTPALGHLWRMICKQTFDFGKCVHTAHCHLLNKSVERPVVHTLVQ